MRKLIFALAIVMNAAPAPAYELRCQTYYDYWNRGSYSRCQPWFSSEEIYQGNQRAAEQGLDYNSRGGTRRASERACTQALESGVDPDLMRSYGCNP